jgi:hypothetical protein
MPLLPVPSSSSSSLPKLNVGGGSGGSRQYTLNQLISAQEAARKAKDRSFLGKIFHGGKGAVTFGLRQILRPSIGATTGIYKGIEGEDAFDVSDALRGFGQGFRLKEHKAGVDILGELGWDKGSKWRSVAGFGVDVLTDPTLPLQVGATVVTGGTAAPALLAGRAAIAGFAKAGATATAKREAARSAEKLLAEAGEGFTMRKNLAHLEQGKFSREIKGGKLNEVEEMELAQAQGMARVEEEVALRESKRLQLSYGVPFSRGKRINLTPASLGGKKVEAFGETVATGGRRISPKAPSLARTAKGSGVLAKLPGMAGAANVIGKTFKHGWNEEEWAKPMLMQSHQAEMLFDKSFKVAHETVGKHATTLSKPEMRDALSWAQERTTLVTRDARGKGTMHKAELEGAVERGAITPAQADFVADWHEYWEWSAARDKTFGVTYDKQLGNKIYVPHIYQRNGQRISKSDIAQAGFTKERIEDLTLNEMEAAAKSEIGKKKDWIADPLHIMAIRTRRGANAQSKEVLFRTMRRAAGVPSRIQDADKIAKFEGRLKKWEGHFKKHEWSVDNRKVGARRSKITLEHRKTHKAKLREIDLHYNKQYAAVHVAYNKGLIDESKVVQMVDDIDKKKAKSISVADKKLERQMSVAHEEFNKKLQYSWEELGRASDHVMKINSLLEKGLRKKNPHVPAGWVELQRKIGGEKFHFPPELEQAMSKVETTFRSDADMEKIVGAWDRAMAHWKVGVTAVNPGYRVRNTLSDVWNMYIAGVPAWAIPVYAKRANKLQRDAAKIGEKIADGRGKYRLTPKEQQTINTIIEAHSHGILSGLFGGDVETVSRMLAQGSKASVDLQTGHLIRAYTRMMGNFNRRWEDKGRLTHYLYRREYEKMGVGDSADWVKKAHFDYTELTPLEREKFKKVLPFYTWTRKNIPYQLTQLAARPGKYATFPKMAYMFEDMAENEDGPMAQPGMMPEWMEEKMAFRVPFFGDNAMTLPLIGVTDLQKVDPTQGLQGMAKGLGSMVTPFAKVPFEIMTGNSLMTGQEIDDGSRKPVSGLAASVLQFVPGADVGTTSRNVRGERVEGVGASPWASYIASQLPMVNAVVNSTSSIAREKRGDNQFLPIIGYAGGVAIYDRDLEAEQTAAMLENQEDVRRVLRNMRREGVVPPAEKHKRTKFEEQVLLPALRGG